MNGDHLKIAADIKLVQLPELNARCDDPSGEAGMDCSEHGVRPIFYLIIVVGLFYVPPISF